MNKKQKSAWIILAAVVALTHFDSPYALAMAKYPVAAREELEEMARQKEEARKYIPEALTLEDCYHLALIQSEKLARLEVEMEKNLADFLKASGQVLGDFNFQMTSFDQQPKNGDDADVTRSRRRERKFVLSQPLFQGFKSYAAIASAGGLRERRTSALERARQMLYLDVANAFYNILRSEREIDITGRTIALFRERVKELEDREEIGRSRTGEVMTAKARLRSFEATLAQQEGDKNRERLLLEFLTGISIMDKPLVDAEAPEPQLQDVEIYALKAQDRQDVQEAASNANIARSKVIVAQSALWPELTLDANFYEKREGSQDGINWDVLFTIDVPIMTGGTTSGEIFASESDWKQAEIYYAEVLRTAELEIRQAYEGYRSAFNSYAALKEAVAAAEENYKIQKDDYAHTLVTNLEVLEALQDLNDVLLSANEARIERSQQFVALQVAIGMGPLEAEVPTTQTTTSMITNPS